MLKKNKAFHSVGRYHVNIKPKDNIREKIFKRYNKKEKGIGKQRDRQFIQKKSLK